MRILNKIELIIITLAIAFLPVLGLAQEIDQLNDQIQQKQDQIQEIKKKSALYQKNIRTKQQEAASLKNQLLILENKIAKTRLDIEASEAEIAKVKLEIRETDLKILTTEDNLENKKNSLTDILQKIHQNDNVNTIKIFLMNDSISDFFNETQYTKDIQNELKHKLDGLKQDKELLLNQKNELDSKNTQLVELRADLEAEKINLTGETVYKENLLISTKKSEKKFSALYQQAKNEQNAISSEISKLEQEARKKLNEKKQDKPQLTDSKLSWPIPKNKITTLFHDPGYPFRYLFEHPAIDVRAAQGTTIKAPAEGYVLKVRNAGMGYSYIALIHANGLSTVFGHVSKIYVKQDEYVSKGEVIGLTGGMPGTPGAGRLTTGPHLHFEVRMNGIAVNPLNYLP